MGLTSGEKKDIYSIAMLFADIQFKVLGSGIDPIAEQANYEKENTLLENHPKLLANLQKAVPKSKEPSENMEQFRSKNPEELFVDYLTQMMNPDKRDDAWVIYKDLWMIYQLSKYPAIDSEVTHLATIERLKEIIKRIPILFLHTNRHKNIEFFENILKTAIIKI
jgi:hypothetical protein